MSRVERVGWVAAVVAVSAVTLGMARMTPAVEGDVTWTVLAVEQRIAGRPNDLQHVLVADAHDLGRDRLQPITWSAPGNAQLIYLLRRAGFTPGRALHALALTAWLVGLAAWSLYFRIAAPPNLLPWLIALFALFRMSHYDGFIYTNANALLWAACPVAALATIRALDVSATRPTAWAFTAGVSTPMLLLLKYSAVFIAAGIGLAWAWNVARRQVGAAAVAAFAAGSAVGTAALAAAGGVAAAAGPSPASALCRFDAAPVLAWGSGGWVMGLSDASAIIDSFLKRSAGSGITDAQVALATTMVVTLLTSALWANRTAVVANVRQSDRARRAGLQLAVAVIVTTSVGLTLLMLRGGCISMESRHQEYGAFLALPFLAQWLVDGVWRRGGTRVVCGACAAVLIGLPAAYGAAALADKALVRTPRLRTAIGPNGIRTDMLAATGTRAFVDEVRGRLEPPGSLLAVSSPDLAILFPRTRVLLLPGTVKDLPWMRYPIRPLNGDPGGEVLLIPGRELAEGDVELQRRAFGRVTTWSPVTLRSLPGQPAWLGR